LTSGIDAASRKKVPKTGNCQNKGSGNQLAKMAASMRRPGPCGINQLLLGY